MGLSNLFHAAPRRLLTAFLSVVLLAATAYALWIFVLQFRAEEPARIAASAALSSDEVMKSIGQPVKVGPFLRGNLVADEDSGTADLILPIRGPKGRGTLREWAQKKSGKWQICSLTFRSSATSTEIEIMPDRKSTCERE